MELISVLDAQGESLGLTKERNEELRNNEYALVVHIWIQNKDGLYLVQQRGRQKQVDPLMWSITAGFVSNDEKSIETVKRELKEELGINVKDKDIKFVKRMFPTKKSNHIADVFVITSNIKLNKINIQVSEIENVKYWDKNKIISNIEDGTFKNFNEMYENYFHYVL